MPDPAPYEHPDEIWLEPICQRCSTSPDDFDGTLILQEYSREAARCELPDCPLKPIKYIRADLWDREIETITELVISDQMMEMSKLLDENRSLKAELDRLKAEIETPRERRGFS